MIKRRKLHQGNMGKPCIHCGDIITYDTPYADNDKFYNTLINLIELWKKCNV